MIDLGVFRPDDRLELLDGLLVVKEPQSSPHAAAVGMIAEALRLAFGPGWFIRQHSPVAANRWSEPEPDVCVVPGSAQDYVHAHPARPVLVVEVARASLRLDRTRKAAIYARAGVADYWIANLDARTLEVHRDPAQDPATGRARYRSVQILGPDDIVTPLAAPDARVLVADLLP